MERQDFENSSDRISEKNKQRRRNWLEWLIAIIALVAFFVAMGLTYGLFYLILGGDVPSKGVVPAFCWSVSGIVAYLVMKLLPKWLFKD